VDDAERREHHEADHAARMDPTAVVDDVHLIADVRMELVGGRGAETDLGGRPRPCAPRPRA
jgi:hypothetical protein